MNDSQFLAIGTKVTWSVLGETRCGKVESQHVCESRGHLRVGIRFEDGRFGEFAAAYLRAKHERGSSPGHSIKVG